MRHVFIVNPNAGPVDSSNILANEIIKIFKDKDEKYEIYITKRHRDSYDIAKKLAFNLIEDTVFYACGGDGTTFDVINGIANQPKAYFSVIPIGSCNDFLKSFPNANFRDVKSIVEGEIVPIDLCKANDYYFINEINIGFDAKVNDDCNNSSLKATNVKKAYRNAILKNLFKFSSYNLTIESKEQTLNNKFLLMVAANGQYYGSKYRCAPYALCNDGLLDIITVRKISRLKFIKIIKKYEKGQHLDNPKYKSFIDYFRTDKVTIKSDQMLSVCLDGEMFHWNEVTVQAFKHQVKMLVPKTNNE